MDLNAGFTDAMNNQRLIHGVLKRVHIFTTRSDYDDYFQEAIILYAQSYTEYCQTHANLDKFNSYIFQKLKWRLTDMLRQEKKYYDFHSLEVFDFQRVPEELFRESLEFIDLQKLSAIEQSLLQEHFIDGDALVILAKRHNYTTRNLRYHRSKLLTKLRNMNIR